MRRSDRVRMVSKGGQVTIPVALRRALDIAPGDRVAFSVEEERLILRPVRESLHAPYGAIEPLDRPEDFGASRDRAVEEHARQAVEEMEEGDVGS